MTAPAADNRRSTEPASPERHLPAHDIDAERAALGAVLICPQLAGPALAVLQPEHFYQPWHAELLAVLQAMHAAGLPIDPITTHAACQQRGLRGNGSRHLGVLLHDLTAAVPVPAAGMAYVAIVVDQAARRRLAQAGSRLTQLAEAGHGELTDIASVVEGELAAVRAAFAEHTQLTRPRPQQQPPAPAERTPMDRAPADLAPAPLTPSVRPRVVAHSGPELTF